MANSLLTINMITREAVSLWKNSNEFLKNINTQYDDSFAQTGAKIGTSLRIRLPNDYTVRTGAAVQVQNTNEQNTTLTVATQKGVDLSFSSAEQTMSLDDFSERILAPAINNLTGAVAADVMSGVDAQGPCNFVANTDSSSNVISPNSTTYLLAGAILGRNSAPMANRLIINGLTTEARVVASLSGLLNPSRAIGKQYEDGVMARALGFDWYSDQTVLSHTTGTYSAGNVLGADQTGTSVTTSAITGTLTAGDIITFSGVNAVNRITKQDTGVLRQFIVTAAVSNGGTSIPIYPAIVPPFGGNPVQYQTVTASPANGATISVAGVATPGVAATYVKNFAYVPEAVTMATADLELPRNGVIEAAREQMDGISLRIIQQYVIGTDQSITRLDVLYGYLWVRPEWAVVVADTV